MVLSEFVVGPLFARSDVLVPIAKALGVTVEELLGKPDRKRTRPVAGGKLGEIFERVSKLPRRQQQRIVELLELFVQKQEQRKIDSD